MSKTIIEDQDDFLKTFLEQEEAKTKPEDKTSKETKEDKSLSKKEEKTKEDSKEDSKEDEDLISLFEKQVNGSEEEIKEEPKKEEVEDTSKETKETKKEKEVKDEYNFKAIANYLAEEGAIDFEDSDDIENTPEVIREAVVKTATNMVNEYKESLPEVVQDLVDYIEKGGRPDQYLLSLQKDIDISTIDLTDEKNQKLVVSEYLKLQGYTPDEVKESIQDFEDGVMLEKQAKIASKKLEKYYDGRTAQLVKEQEDYQKAFVLNQQKEIENIKKEIKGSKEIAGLPISDTQKDAFIKYLLQPDKSGKTAYQKETEEDATKVGIELAWVKFNKYDWTKATKQAKKEVTDNIKQMFKQSETTIKGKSHEAPAKQKADDFGSFGKFFGKTSNK